MNWFLRFERKRAGVWRFPSSARRKTISPTREREKRPGLGPASTVLQPFLGEATQACRFNELLNLQCAIIISM